MSVPKFIIAELKADQGQPLVVITATPREFKTGSRGFYANQKFEIDGKRYQMQIQIVEIGSRKKVESQDG